MAKTDEAIGVLDVAEPPRKSKAVATATHCWHQTTEHKTMHKKGGHVEETCCHCGSIRSVKYVNEPLPGHGPFVSPQKTVTVYPGGTKDDLPCRREKYA